ncbi:MAG TPA: ankyrin repeat domain-containing protein, partial [Sulfurimonas sp.]|nr:ankyrin repeat domain-containing protein [Sulfurimonas sp.]
MKLIQILGLTLVPLVLFANPLHDAAEDGDLKKLKKLISKGEDVNEKNVKYKQTPLHIAAYNEHSSIVKFLLRHGLLEEVYFHLN